MKRRNHKIRRVVETVCSMVWAIEEQALNAIVEVLQLRAEGYAFTEDEVQSRILAKHRLKAGPLTDSIDDDDDDDDGPTRAGSVAILPLTGILAPRLNYFQQISGGTSTQEFAGWFKEALADDKVTSIVLLVDSPGGDAKGNEELAQLIRESRGQKPIIAVVDGLAASAAYYIASAADKIVVSPSSEVGSIGTYMIHGESSRADANAGRQYTVIKAGENKAIGNSVEPLTSGAKSVLQERIDDFNALFVNAVAKNRGVNADFVQKNFGQGKVMIAAKAIEAGLADRIGNLETVVAELQKAGPPPRGGSGLPLTSQKETVVNPEIVAALVALSLVAVGAVATDVTAALSKFYGDLGQAVPTDEKQIVRELKMAAYVAGQKTPAPPLAHGNTPAAPPPNTAASLAERQEIAKQERARIEDLRARAELLRVDAQDLQAAIDNGTPVAEALVAWTAAKAAAQPPVSTGRDARVTADGEDRFAIAALEALAHRAGAHRQADGTPAPLRPEARDLRHKSLLQIAEQCLRATGRRQGFGDDDELACAALEGDGRRITIIRAASGGDGAYARPADFPNLLSSLMGRMLDVQMDFAEPTYRNWAAQIDSVPDFRPKTLIATGEFGEFPLVRDGEDFEQSSIAEEASWIAVDSYGDEWQLTPRMIVSDDLSALQEAAQDKVTAHEYTLNRLCVNVLTGNPTMLDGNALFSSAHGNDRSSGAAPSTTELAAMRLLMRKMTGVSAKRKINLTLTGLLVPEDLETTTQQLLSSNVVIVPTATTSGELFRGKVQYWVEPMLGEASATIYYGFADKSKARAIVYTHMKGFEGMKSRNYFNPKNNCRVFQFEGRFAAAARNPRGAVRNNGS